MSDRDALFQAILAAPDDDAPRLVYADWLDEHGEADRAEFIRVQCELARLPFYDPRSPTLELRANDLITRHGRAWRIRDLAARQGFRRGFVEELTIEPELYFARAAGLFRQAPVRWVRFPGFIVPHEWRWEAVAPLEGIEFADNMPGTADAPLGFDLPRLRRLKAAGLTATATFLRDYACPQLEALDVSGSPASDAGLADLLQGVSLNRLRAFAYDAAPETDYYNRLRAIGARMLATTPLDGLAQLHLRGQRVGEAGLFHLVQSPHLTRLEELYLDDNDIGLIGPTGIEDLCSSRNLGRLRVLSLAGNPLGLPAVRELAAWPGLARLRWLDLSDCGLGPSEVRPLAHSSHLHPGLGLRLDGNNFPPQSLFPADVLRPAPASVS